MRLGTSTKHLRYAPTSPEMAVKLALVTGYSVEFWLTHQARYVARRTYLGPCFLGLASPGYKRAGIVTHNWRNPQELVREVFAHRRVACADAFRDLCAGSDSIAFLGSGGGAATAGAEWTWSKSSLMRTGMVWKAHFFVALSICPGSFIGCSSGPAHAPQRRRFPVLRSPALRLSTTATPL